MLHVFYSIAQLNTKARQFGFLGLLLPVGLRKFSTNNNEEVVYRWTNGFEGYRDLPGAKACNTKPQIINQARRSAALLSERWVVGAASRGLA